MSFLKPILDRLKAHEKPQKKKKLEKIKGGKK